MILHVVELKMEMQEIFLHLQAYLKKMSWLYRHFYTHKVSYFAEFSHVNILSLRGFFRMIDSNQIN